MKRGRGGARREGEKETDEDKQPDRRRDHLLRIHYILERQNEGRERAIEAKRGGVRWGGRGGGASVGEARGCVLT